MKSAVESHYIRHYINFLINFLPFLGLDYLHRNRHISGNGWYENTFDSFLHAYRPSDNNNKHSCAFLDVKIRNPKKIESNVFNFLFENSSRHERASYRIYASVITISRRFAETMSMCVDLVNANRQGRAWKHFYMKGNFLIAVHLDMFVHIYHFYASLL